MVHTGPHCQLLIARMLLSCNRCSVPFTVQVWQPLPVQEKRAWNFEIMQADYPPRFNMNGIVQARPALPLHWRIDGAGRRAGSGAALGCACSAPFKPLARITHAQPHAPCQRHASCPTPSALFSTHGQVLDFVRGSGAEERKIQLIACLEPEAS